MAGKTRKDELPYRPCVGLMLVNRDGRVFVGRRSDSTADAWQMPQGGIDKAEAPEAAALRELAEEIGTDKADIVGAHPDWLSYDLPDHLIGKLWKGKYRGQTQKWFALRFTGTDGDIDLNTGHPEFDAWKWVDLDALPDLIVPFKRATYLQVIDGLRPFVRKIAQ